MAVLAIAMGALTAALLTPVPAQAQTPSSTSQVAAAAAEAAAVETKYPAVHFASQADAIRYGRDLAMVTPDGVPPPDPGSEYTVAQFKAHLIGYRVGPNANTYNGMFTITGWSASGKGWVKVRSAATCPACTTIGVDAVTPDGLPNWANPGAWNWRGIMGTFWDDLWNGCAKGALTGVVGTAGATLAANMAARGGLVYLGPYGYAAFAVSACIMGIINK